MISEVREFSDREMMHQALAYWHMRTHFELKLAELDSSQILGDFSIEASGAVVNPLGDLYCDASIPLDYFGDFVDQSEVPNLLRHLMHQRRVSMKSKLAQSGLAIAEPLRINTPYIQMPVAKTEDSFVFPLAIHNLNPANAIAFSTGNTETGRFFLPAPALKGRELFGKAMDMNCPELQIMDRSGDFHSLDELANKTRSSSLMDYRGVNRLEAVAIPIVQQFEYTNDGRRIEVSSLEAISSKNRTQLDQYIGLNPVPSDYFSHRQSLWRVVITEGPQLKMTDDTCGVIDLSANKATEWGNLRHTPSPLIDPSFKGAIRFEEEYAGVVGNLRNNFVLMDLHPAS